MPPVFLSQLVSLNLNDLIVLLEGVSGVWNALFHLGEFLASEGASHPADDRAVAEEFSMLDLWP